MSNFIAGYAFAVIEAAFVLWVLRRRGFVSWGAKGWASVAAERRFLDGYNAGMEAGYTHAQDEARRGYKEAGA